MPTSTHPAAINAAPIHQLPGNFSLNTAQPSNAVTTKFADVFVIEVLVVDGDAVNARVKSAHIAMLHVTFRPRQICFLYVRLGIGLD